MDGILYQNDEYRTTIVHVHGSYGNFYQSRFVRVMAEVCVRTGLNLLSLNLSAHDGLTEGYSRRDDFAYAGGALSDFSDCVADVAGAVCFAEQFSEKVVLQGHSLGCDRVLQYVISRDAENELVLLAPCDSYQLQANWIAPESVELQIDRLRRAESAQEGVDWLAPTEYGIKGGEDWTYTIPISRRAFLSIADGPPFRLIRLSRPASFALAQRAFVYIGGKDALQVWSARKMLKYLRERIPNLTAEVVAAGDHVMTGCERGLAASITEWVKSDAIGKSQRTRTVRRRR